MLLGKKKSRQANDASLIVLWLYSLQGIKSDGGIVSSPILSSSISLESNCKQQQQLNKNFNISI